MKSTQERSNESLPPKKREIPTRTLPLTTSGSPQGEERPLVAAAQNSDGQHTENLAWLASVVSVHEKRESRANSTVGTSSSCPSSPNQPANEPRHKLLPSDSSLSSLSSSYSSVTSHLAPSSRTLPLAIYTSPHPAPGGALQYTSLPPNMHFITPPFASPYTSYVPPLGPPPPPPPISSSSSSTSVVVNSSSSSTSSSSSSSKLDQQHQFHHQHHQRLSKSSDSGLTLAHSTHYPSVNSNRTHVTSPDMHPVPLVVQYLDGPPGPKREVVMNGEPERSRRFGSPPESRPSGTVSRVSSTHQHHQQRQHLGLHQHEPRHVVLPAEYIQDTSGLQASVMIVPKSHGSTSNTDNHPMPGERGGISAGRPVARVSSSSSSSVSSHTFLPPPPPPHDGLKGVPQSQTVIQTSADTLSLGLSPSFYASQQPIIGYIAPGLGQTPLGYHQSPHHHQHPGPLPPHLLIPGAQPLIIPVTSNVGSGGNRVDLTTASSDGSHSNSASPTFASPAPPTHTFLTPALPPTKAEPFEVPATPYQHNQGGSSCTVAQVLQPQLHLPLVHTPAGLLASTALPALPLAMSTTTSATVATANSSPMLPPYFVKGSIIQLADGELKRVEDLSTEDFLQSAEVSSDLRIDSSTVERISGSPTPNYALIQFAVGEHRAQVSVEVLVEYPFFVFGQGWSSCSPDRTTQLLQLPCARLAVGDVCISLTLKSLKNGTLRRTAHGHPQNQHQNPNHTHEHRESPENQLSGARSFGVGSSLRQPSKIGGGGTVKGGGEAENGVSCDGDGDDNGRVSGRFQTGAENGEARPVVGRKRRWSAPEGRKVERPGEEDLLPPPVVLHKSSFLSREVKISIEGRSNMGK